MLNRSWVFGLSVGTALVIAAAAGNAGEAGNASATGNAGAGASNARSQNAGEHGYRTGTLVPSDKNECAGVPNCLSATLPATTVPARGQTQIRFACPNSHPNLWGWDAAQHEHIAVRMVAVDQFTVTVQGVNSSDAAGDLVVSLGCSTQVYSGNGIQLSRQLAPTAELPDRKPPRTFRGRLSQQRNGVQAAFDNACDNVPDCQPQGQPTFSMGGWASTTKSYQCQKPFPYAWNFTWSQTGSPSVSAIGAIFAVNPGTFDVLLTNWNPFATDDVTIVVGCSTRNSFDGSTCGAPQGDPGCPQVAGSQHQYCTNSPVPVCFATYKELCEPSNQLYSCTIDVLPLPWCQPCTSQ